MTEKDKMHIGELYLPGDPEIMEWQTKCLDRLYDFNNTRPTEFESRRSNQSDYYGGIALCVYASISVPSRN